MKRVIIILLGGMSVLVFSLTLIALGKVSLGFLSADLPLQVESFQPVRMKVGETAVVDLYGQSFETDLTINMVMNNAGDFGLDTPFPVEGVYHSMLIVDETLYMGSIHDGLKVIDITTGDSPQLRHEYHAGKKITGILERDGYLYLAMGQFGVTIMQVMESGELMLVSDIQTGSAVLSICFVSDRLAVSSVDDNVSLYDLESSLKPRLLKKVNIDAQAHSMAAFEGRLYLACSNGTITTFSPERDRLVQETVSQMGDSPRDLVVFQGSLYAAVGNRLLRYDLAQPDHPLFVGAIDQFRSAGRLYASDGSLYVIDNFARLSVVDPDTMAVVRGMSFSFGVQTLAESKGTLYVAGKDSGLQIMSRKRNSPQGFFKTYSTPGSSHDIFIIDGWLYVADTRGGILLKRLGSEDRFRQISPGRGESFCFDPDRNLLFVALGRAGIEIFDVSTPGSPQSVALWSDVTVWRMALSGRDLVVSRGAFGVNLIDSSDLKNPRNRNFYPEIHALDIMTDRRLVYVASKDNGLNIYRNTPVAGLVLLSKTATPFPMNQFANTVAVDESDGIACVANGRSGLMIVDVRQPRKPEILSLIDIPGFSKKVEIVGGKVYVSSQGGGISVVNISTPERPRLESYIDLQGVSRGLLINHDLLYVTQNDAGVSSLPLPLDMKDIEFVGPGHIRVTLPSATIAGSYDLQISDGVDAVVLTDVVLVSE